MTRRRSGVLLTRLVGGIDVAVGLVLLARPEQVLAAVSDNAQPAAGWARVLGIRYLAQGAAELALPSAATLAGSAGVDMLHGLSMFGLAAVRPSYRRPALVSATLATVGAAVAAIASRQLNGTAP